MTRHALAILTCVPANADAAVRRRLPSALDSLKSSGYDGAVVVVDDGSSDSDHSTFLGRLGRRYRVVRRSSQGGIARAKNTCIRVLLEMGAEVGFLADDDVEFRPGWDARYLAAHEATGIPHFSWASDTFFRNMRKWPRTINGHRIVQTSRLNGAFLTFTAALIAKVGGFRVMPRPWGHEHIHWTNRILKAGLIPFYCDVEDSNSVLALGPHSHASCVGSRERRAWSRENQPAADDLTQVTWPLEE